MEYIHTYIHTSMHACMHACMHTNYHTNIHTCIDACLHHTARDKPGSRTPWADSDAAPPSGRMAFGTGRFSFSGFVTEWIWGFWSWTLGSATRLGGTTDRQAGRQASRQTDRQTSPQLPNTHISIQMSPRARVYLCMHTYQHTVNFHATATCKRVRVHTTHALTYRLRTCVNANIQRAHPYT